MAFKLRHKPTGLFFTPYCYPNRAHLSPRGRVYGKKPSYRPDCVEIDGNFQIVPKSDWEVVAVGADAPQQRFTIVSDGAHRYAVPVEKVEEFNRWADHHSDIHSEWFAFKGEDFGKYRVGGGLTFTDPKHSDGRGVGE